MPVTNDHNPACGTSRNTLDGKVVQSVGVAR
ncbi:hypothetical protein RHI9324_00926 [Rhizobium sp. CECT 9324]|nr:hypothetical protein RHI9324_00926 [Rhizobium sp. CECT 9324]